MGEYRCYNLPFYKPNRYSERTVWTAWVEGSAKREDFMICKGGMHLGRSLLQHGTRNVLAKLHRVRAYSAFYCFSFFSLWAFASKFSSRCFDAFAAFRPSLRCFNTPSLSSSGCASSSSSSLLPFSSMALYYSTANCQYVIGHIFDAWLSGDDRLLGLDSCEFAMNRDTSLDIIFC